VIDLWQLPPVIAEGIDPRLHTLIREARDGVRVLFAGPDQTFLDALRRIYGVPLPCPDVLISGSPGQIVITVAARRDADGLVVVLTPADGNSIHVQPALAFTEHRKREPRQLKDGPEHADLLLAALDDLLFRRIIPAELQS
jgi:hypothetical protein